MQTVSLEKGTLIVRKIAVNQGPVSIDVDFAAGKASGRMSMSGQDRPVAADLGGELFADSASQWSSIGCLPLAEGYSATFRNFSPADAEGKTGGGEGYRSGDGDRAGRDYSRPGRWNSLRRMAAATVRHGGSRRVAGRRQGVGGNGLGGRRADDSGVDAVGEQL